MVCSRCIFVVKQQLTTLDIEYKKVELGEIETTNDLDANQTHLLKERLQQFGFDLMDDRKAKTIEKIKTLLIDLIQNKENDIHINYSKFLTENLQLDYSYISNLYSSIENITIEKFIIELKIEKVKELLVYHDLTLNEIAYRLNYSSVAALSNQFKKITGLTPSYFKQLKKEKQK